jgi:hypothetical protein
MQRSRNGAGKPAILTPRVVNFNPEGETDMTKNDLRNLLREMGTGHPFDHQCRRFLIEQPGHKPDVTAEELGALQRELVAELAK